MADGPLVSAVTIFLNEEGFLADAVESVIDQSYENWELILVDDGSTDGSPALARSYADRDDRIRYVNHPGNANRGMSASRNRGVAASSGELIAFVDADDTWLPQKLERQVDLLTCYPEVGMVYGRTEWWYSWTDDPNDESRDYLYDPGVELDSVVPPPALLASLIRDDGSPPYTCSAMIRRALYARIGGFEEAFRGLFEDQAFFAKVFLEAPVFVSGESWDRYRQHDASSCAVGLLTGEFHEVDLNPAREAFLEWLDAHLRRRRFRDPELLRLLSAELAPYRHPTAPAFVTDVSIASETPELLGCHLDFPKKSERTASRFIPVLGWAVGAESPIRDVEIRIRGHVHERFPTGMRRPDLARAFPERRDATGSGFRTRISAQGMEQLPVEIVAVLEDGKRAPLASFRVRRDVRDEDAARGLALVSVIVESSAGRLSACVLERLAAQTYPCIEVVVVRTHETSGAERLADHGLYRVVAASEDDWREVGLSAASGEFVCHLSEGQELAPTALEEAVAALMAQPAAASAVAAVKPGGQAPSLYHRFALEERGERQSSERLGRARFGSRGTRASRPSAPGRRLILMYHRVATVACDPWSLAVTEEAFASQVELLRSEHRVVPLDTLGGDDPQTDELIITFDDGYADNLRAARLLAEKGLPATYFLVAGMVGADREFWWDRLEHIFLGSASLPERLEVTSDGIRLQVDLSGEGEPPEEHPDQWRATAEPVSPRQRAYLRIYDQLRPLESRTREKLVDRLAEWANVESGCRDLMRPLSLDELAELSCIEQSEIGAHTMTHPVLGALPPPRQWEEIQGSKFRLEQVIGSPVRSFAYPHGGNSDYTRETTKIVEQSGFRRACAAGRGVVNPTSPTYELPRLMVESWDAGEFSQQIEAAFVRSR